MTLYLVRHAQSMPKTSQPCAEWRLSPVGARQARQLAGLLGPLGIERVFSSPFTRALETAMPFAEKHALEVLVMEDLRERLVVKEGDLLTDEVWCRSWEDFAFASPGCETSAAAQVRICRAMRHITGWENGTSAVFTHGNVIGLFLNAVTSNAGRKEAEALRNPEVLKIEWRTGVFTWDRYFHLAGLERFATAHGQTPREKETKPAAEGHRGP